VAQLQLALDGSWDMHSDKHVKRIMSRCTSNTSGDRQKEFLLLYDTTEPFLRNALTIDMFVEMRELFMVWLDSLPVIESIARASRPSAYSGNDCELSVKAPEWYDDYLKSEHMSALRRRAHAHYRGCVLCGSTDTLHIHHRHYQTLGREELHDVSILCDEHHSASHRFLGLRVPQEPPARVRAILGI